MLCLTIWARCGTLYTWFTGGVKGILVQYTHGKSDQSVGVLPIPLVIGGISNQSVGVLPIPLVIGGKSNQSIGVLPTPLTTAGKLNQHNNSVPSLIDFNQL